MKVVILDLGCKIFSLKCEGITEKFTEGEPDSIDTNAITIVYRYSTMAIDLSHTNLLDLYSMRANTLVGMLSNDYRELSLANIIDGLAPDFFPSKTMKLFRDHLLATPWQIVAKDKDVIRSILRAMMKSGEILNSVCTVHYQQIVKPALFTLNRITRVGLKVDRNSFNEAREDAIRGLAQIKPILSKKYDVTNIHDKKRIEVIRKLGEDQEFEEMIHEARVLSMGLSSLLNYRKAIDSSDKIHPAYLFHAVSSRASTAFPSLGNMPRVYRYLIGCEDDSRIFVDSDMSNLEPRIAASRYQDEQLIEDCDCNDMYLMLLGEANIEATFRATAKRVLNGKIYGSSRNGLSESFSGAELIAAELFYDFIGKRYSALWSNQDNEVESCRIRGEVKSLGGHVRKTAMTDQNEVARKIKNNIIQSDAADVFYMAIVELENRLRVVPTAKIVFVLHDSVLVETDSETAVTVRSIVSKTMSEIFENYFKPVKFPVKTEIKKRWGDR